jgi:hypothetical protein
MNKQIAKEAGLVFGGKNKEGEDEYIGTQKRWQSYEALEMLEDIDKNGFNGHKQEDNFSCPIGSFHSENGCVYPDKTIDKLEPGNFPPSYFQEQEENDVREREYIFNN